MNIDQVASIHWPFGDVSITVDGRNPASGEISPIEGRASIPLVPGTGQVPKISSAGGVGNVRGSGRSKRTSGSGGICG